MRPGQVEAWRIEGIGDVEIVKVGTATLRANHHCGFSDLSDDSGIEAVPVAIVGVVFGRAAAAAGAAAEGVSALAGVGADSCLSAGVVIVDVVDGQCVVGDELFVACGADAGVVVVLGCPGTRSGGCDARLGISTCADSADPIASRRG